MAVDAQEDSTSNEASSTVTRAMGEACRDAMGSADTPTLPLTIDGGCGQLEILTVHRLPWRDESDPHRVRSKTGMDSGAAESVGLPSMAPGVAIEQSPGSKRRQH